MERGLVTVPEVQGGKFAVPELTLGEFLDVQWWDVGNRRALGIVESLPAEERDRLNEIADTAFLAEYLYRRLAKVNPAFTKAAFEARWNTPPRVEALAVVVAQADEERRPDFTGAPGKGASARGTGGWLRNAWRKWRRISPSSPTSQERAS